MEDGGRVSPALEADNGREPCAGIQAPRSFLRKTTVFWSCALSGNIVYFFVLLVREASTTRAKPLRWSDSVRKEHDPRSSFLLCWVLWSLLPISLLIYARRSRVLPSQARFLEVGSMAISIVTAVLSAVASSTQWPTIVGQDPIETWALRGYRDMTSVTALLRSSVLTCFCLLAPIRWRLRWIVPFLYVCSLTIVSLLSDEPREGQSFLVALCLLLSCVAPLVVSRQREKLGTTCYALSVEAATSNAKDIVVVSPVCDHLVQTTWPTCDQERETENCRPKCDQETQTENRGDKDTIWVPNESPKPTNNEAYSEATKKCILDISSSNDTDHAYGMGLLDADLSQLKGIMAWTRSPLLASAQNNPSRQTSDPVALCSASSRERAPQDSVREPSKIKLIRDELPHSPDECQFDGRAGPGHEVGDGISTWHGILPGAEPELETFRQASTGDVLDPEYGASQHALEETGELARLGLESRLNVSTLMCHATGTLSSRTPAHIRSTPRVSWRDALRSNYHCSASKQTVLRSSASSQSLSSFNSFSPNSLVSLNLLASVATSEDVKRKYTFTDEARFGGQATVYRVLDENHMSFALKMVCLPGQLHQRHFPRNLQGVDREIRLLRSMSWASSVVVRVHESWMEPTLTEAAIVMEWLPVTLADILDRCVRSRDDLDIHDMTRWMSCMSTGLAAVHSQNIMHRDIKPQNVLLSEDLVQCKLADFGIGRTLAPSVEESSPYSSQSSIDFPSQYGSGRSLGTMHTQGSAYTVGRGTDAYMSPEVRDGRKYSLSADVYSLGLVYFDLLRVGWHSEIAISDMNHAAIATDFTRQQISDDRKNLSFICVNMLLLEPEHRPSALTVACQQVLSGHTMALIVGSELALVLGPHASKLLAGDILHR